MLLRCSALVAWLLLLAAAGAPTGGPSGSPAASPLAACEARFAAAPDDEASSSCFFELTRVPELAPLAAAELERLLASHPGHPWLSLYLGHVETKDPARALALYQAAADHFQAHRVARGEVLARSNRQRLLIAEGRTEEAGREAEAAERVAVASGDPDLIARAKIVLARHLFTLGQDLERVDLLLREAERVAFPRGSYPLQRDCLHWLANVGLELGRYQEARRSFLREAALAVANHDPFAEASARYGLARAAFEQAYEAPRPGGRTESVELARQALASAEAARNQGVQAKAHWLLGLLTTGDEARGHLEQCLRIAATIRDRSYCLNALARHTAAADPQKARAAIQEALALAHRANDPWSMAYSWRERMQVSWAVWGTSAPRQAAADSQAALDAIEALRDLQAGTARQAELFSTWSDDYAWLAGRLLQAWGRGGDGAELAEAFRVMERMHARALLDTLAAAHATPPLSDETKALQSARADLLADIAQVQRHLFAPELPPLERQRAKAELARLELAEADLRNQLAPANPAFSARAPSFASFAALAEVQKELAPDEALLSFQVAPDRDVFGGFGGGSWVLVSTRAGTRAYPLLRDRVGLRPAIRLFNGLFERRDGAEAGPAAVLYEILLGDALRGLPAGVRRLVIVPDDVLNQLPFAALRASRTAPPLAERYQLTLIPSATLWLRWKHARPLPARRPVLALADPVLPAAAGRGLTALWRPTGAPAERAAIFASGLRLEPLPFARSEGKTAVGRLGGGSELRIGAAASEGFVKSAALSDFGILHFATHAVLDEQNPERSGVLLTPRPASEDGLLQIREIVQLELPGRVVILSSCRSASGAVLRGEGVMGLARAFFQAGAHTVVASLWPVRDDDGAALFDRFYAHLAAGRSVAQALRAAQRDRLADGAPASAWAGVVVLGDGDLVPLPGGRRGSERRPQSAHLVPWALAVLATLGALGFLAILIRNRTFVPE